MSRAPLLLGLMIAGVASHADAQEHLLNEISRAWQARQDRCTTGIVRWKQDHFYARDAYGANDRVNSIIVDYEFAFKQDGQCTYRLDGLRWNTDTRQFDHETLQQAISLGDVKTLFAGQRHGPFPAGWICRRTTLEDGENYNFEPPLLAFRPFADSVSWFNLAPWDIVGNAEEIDGRTCVHLVKGSEHLWLDPGYDYLPVRHDWLLPGGELYAQLDTDYVEHELVGWVPGSWRYLRAGRWDGAGRWRKEVTERFTSTVTGMELNIAIPDSKFDIVFPPGTRVRNERTEQGGIIREDGSMRLIDRSELVAGRSWDDLMNSDPPSLQLRRQTWFLAFAAIGIATMIAIVIYTARRAL